ncbi:MAG: UPF0182 family protein, partial [Fimbriimonadaceae bacterium]
MPNKSAGGDKRMRLGCGLGICLAAVVALALLSIGPYTEYLWYAEDAGYVRVFTLQYTVRGLLFGVAFLVAWLVLSVGWRQALQFKFVYVEAPEGPIRNITSAVMLVQRYGAEAVRILSLLGGVICGLALSAEWQTYLLAMHGHQFGRRDPVFDWDYGFFVFSLPWYEACLALISGVTVLMALTHVAVAVGLQVVQRVAPVEANLKKVTARACGWAGVALIVIAVRIGFSCFDYGTDQGAQFVGAGYTGVMQLKLTGIFAALVAVLGALILVFRNLNLAWKGGAACAAFFLVGVALLPAVVQRIHVEPDKNHVEAPFARRALDATRYAYDLNTVDVHNMPTLAEPTPEEVKAAKGTLDNMRLRDPSVMQAAIDQLQSFKQYYAFNDVDIDRYKIQGADGATHTRM